jgi:hypothetical protein
MTYGVGDGILRLHPSASRFVAPTAPDFWGHTGRHQIVFLSRFLHKLSWDRN